MTHPQDPRFALKNTQILTKNTSSRNGSVNVSRPNSGAHTSNNNTPVNRDGQHSRG